MATFMRVFHVVLSSPVLFMLATLNAQPLAAQEGAEAIIGPEFGSYPLETGFIVKAYASNDTNDAKNSHLFLTPFFAFEADKDGKLVVRLDDTDSKGRRRVTINLLAYPERQKEAIANRIQINEQRLVPQGRFAHVRTDDLITLGFRRLSIVEVSDEPVFKAIPPSDGVTNQAKFELTADLPAAEAKEFMEALNAGRRTVTFEIHASLNARRIVAAATLTARRAVASDSDAYKILSGNATLFKAGVQGGVTVTPSAVMRNQRDRIAAIINKELESKLIVDGTPKEINWLKRQFDGFMEQAFKPEVIQNDFGQAAARLYAYDFKTSDLNPDEIGKMVADVRDTFRQKKDEHEFKEAETSASVMFGVFSGKGNFRVKTDRLEEMMRDNGWRFELEGGVKVPRSLEVYVVDMRSFHVTGSFSGIYEEGQRGIVVYQERFSTVRTLDPSKPIVQEPWAEVLALRQKIQKLEQQGTDEAKRLTTFMGSNLEYKYFDEAINSLNTDVPQYPNIKTITRGPFGSKVVAAWYEPIYDIISMNEFKVFRIKPNGNNIDIEMQKFRPGGAAIHIRYHILYIK